MITRNPLPSEAPGDFPSRRWDQLRRDVADFLASPWAMEAARLGWTDLDLFGVDADRPYTRIDGLGLVPALDGCKIVALSAEGAILETPGGVRQSYRRKAGSAGPGAGVEAGLVTRSGRDAGRHRSPISCPPLLGDFGDHVVIARYPLQQPLAPAGRDIIGQLADFCGTEPPIGG